jgi:hypothetical protein
MTTCKFTLVGIAPLSQSAPIQSRKNTGEGSDAFEERTWRERLHVDIAGNAFIPPSALKNCLAEVAKYLSESVPGKGKSTYTKHFEAGLMVTDPLTILGADGAPIKGAKVVGERLFVPADGKRGSGKRVWRTFPLIPQWQAAAVVYLLDPVLTDKPSKVLEYAEHAGKFIGLGRFRPRNNGFYGRFNVTDWSVSQ